MTNPISVAVLMFFVGTLAPIPGSAQELPAAQELKRMYDDALVQLKAAQDRKNELATENERLKVRIAELEHELAGARATENRAKQEAVDLANATYALRAHYAAWQTFIERFPRLKATWQAFLDAPLLSPEPPAWDGAD